MRRKRLTRREKLEILKLAKDEYIDHGFMLGMCRFIDKAVVKYMWIKRNLTEKELIQQYGFTKWSYKFIYDTFPEFNPQFLNSQRKTNWEQKFWWNLSDRDSRINAFDILINCYK